MVNISQVTRQQYVTYLKSKKTANEDAAVAIGKCFTDQVLSNFTYNGLNHPQHPRKAMKEYMIFTECFLDAWDHHEVTEHSIKRSITLACQKAKQHISSARYYQRYRGRLLEKRKVYKKKTQIECLPYTEICNNAIIKIEPNNAEISIESCIQKTTAKPLMNIANKPVKSSKAVRVAGFDFPLTCEEDIDRLELMVNRNPFIKSQYIKYLTIHKPRNVDVGQIFNRFFDDEAMANFTWTGSDSTTAAKKAMKDYAIFTGCMLEAWSDQGVTDDMLVESLKKALLLISRRRYVKNYNQRKRLQLKGAET